MPTKTQRVWILTDQHFGFADKEPDNRSFRIWLIPHPDNDDRPVAYSGLFPSVVETVKWYESNYPSAVFDAVTVQYDNGAQLVIENEGYSGDENQWLDVDWWIDKSGLDRRPQGHLTEPYGRKFSASVENIMDGIPSLWKAVDDARSTS
jgi:hypothetical protein